MIADSSYRDFLEELAARRFSPEANAQCQRLMERNNFGELTDAEREELTGLVRLSESMSLVRALAFTLLGRSPVVPTE